jgi:hypothetical protein
METWFQLTTVWLATIRVERHQQLAVGSCHNHRQESNHRGDDNAPTDESARWLRLKTAASCLQDAFEGIGGRTHVAALR